MSNNNSNVFERNPKKTITVLILFLFLLLDFGSAAVLRLLGVFEPSYRSSKVLEAVYRRSDKVFHHTLRKSVTQNEAEWGRHYYAVHTNSLGFKDRQVRDIKLQSDKPRIVFIGDSFTEGVGMEYEKSFVGQIDTALATKNIEVLNTAVTSYAPIIYWRKIDYLLNDVGLKFDHLVVFVDLSDVEDEALGYTFDDHHNVISRSTIGHVGQTTADKKVPQQEKPFSLKEFFTQHTVITGRLRNLAGYLRRVKRGWRDGLNQRRARWTLDDKLYNEYGKTGLTLAQQHMTELKQLLDKHQITMTLAVYPWPDQIYAKDYPNKQSQTWQAWSQQNHVPFIDLFPAFMQGDAEQTIKTYYINGDVHWNEKGHALVASEFLKSFSLPSISKATPQ